MTGFPAMQVDFFDPIFNVLGSTNPISASTFVPGSSSSSQLYYSNGDAEFVIQGSGFSTANGGSAGAAGATITGILIGSGTNTLGTINSFSISVAANTSLADANVFNQIYAAGMNVSFLSGADLVSALPMLEYIAPNGFGNGISYASVVPAFSLSQLFPGGGVNPNLSTVLAAVTQGFDIADASTATAGYSIPGILSGVLGTAAEGNLTARTLTDNGEVVIGPNSISIPSATMLAKLQNANGTPYTIGITAGGSDIQSNIDLLENLVKNNHLVSLTPGSSGGTPTFTVAKAETDIDALHLITKSEVYGYTISDTAADLLAAADTLNSWATTDNVGFAVSPSTSFAVNVATYLHIKSADTAFLSHFTGSYPYSWAVTDTASNILANVSSLTGLPNGSTVTISDTAAHISANLDAIQAAMNANSGWAPNIVLTDPSDPVNVTATQYAFGADQGAIALFAAPYTVAVANGTTTFNNYMWASLGGLTITGSGNATILDNNNNDTITGGGGNDTFVEYNKANNTTQDGKNNTLNGQGGFNEVVYDFASAGALTHNANGTWTVTKPASVSDVLSNIEVVVFSDKSIAIRTRTEDDFSQSGTSDVLYRNDSSGDTGFYRISGGSNAGWTDIGASSTAYSIVGTGDFIGNGTEGVLYRSATTGDTGFYATSNGVNPGWPDIGASSTAYGVVGVGDFTGNGTDDVLYRNNVTGDTGFYAISNGVNTGWHDVGASSTAYTVVGVGDFLGNGTEDILYRNNATGDTGFYAISNGAFTGWAENGGWSPDH